MNPSISAFEKKQAGLSAALESKALELYAQGLSYQDIAAHFKMSGVDISPNTVEIITDKLLPLITEWRRRSLANIYPVLFFDKVLFERSHNGRVVTQVIYNVLGINQAGHKEILGFYMTESENTHFWLGVFNDLKQRGVEDIFIACVNNLACLSSAIKSCFPKTHLQLCVIQKIRNSLKYIAREHKQEFLQDLKSVYQAPHKDIAEHHLLMLDKKWRTKYPLVIKAWHKDWRTISHFFQYPEEIRNILYKEKAMEEFHHKIRKFMKTKEEFTSEVAIFKPIYYICQKIAKKWTLPLENWVESLYHLNLCFKDRLNSSPLLKKPPSES